MQLLWIGVGGLTVLASLIIRRYRAALASAKAEVEALNKRRQSLELGSLPPPSEPFEFEFPIIDGDPAAPPVPDELVEAITNEHVVLFCGAGLSAQANLPTTTEVLRTLLMEEPQDRAKLRLDLVEGRLSDVAEVLLRRRDRQAIVASIARQFEGEATRSSPLHESLSKLPFVGAVTTAWDSLAERAFRTARPRVAVLNAEPSSALVTPPQPDDFVVVKLHGSIANPESFLFTTEEAVRAIHRNRLFSRTLAAMLGSRSVFFIGTSLRFIQELLAGTRLSLSDMPHFALAPAQEATPLQQELFKGKFGIHVIPFKPSPGFPEVGLFVQALSERVAKARRTTKRAPLQRAVLGSAKLTNIGAFKELSVQFNPRWNIVLGNNGSGKSTLLRAIALGLCGDDVDASRSAKKLLRADTNEGSIELTVGNTKYTTLLQRDGDKVRVLSQFTALQSGSWVVLGFPPLRGVSTRDPSGVGPAGSDRPMVDDLHPLIRGSTDERLNDLKQWLVNIDSGMRSSDPEEREMNTRLHASFWSLLAKLTPGVKIEPGGVRSGTWEVLVKTEDGPVSIDQVSQGMSSIFGWLGTALQRMHEIHRAAEDPEKEPALLLVDELDAHLHPEWQQRLVALIREHFSNLQIIATSHSPLVVAGMKADEVFISSRDDDDRTLVDLRPVDPKIPFELLRFDQILMSPLFGLTSTRSEASKKEYARLAAKEGRTEQEEKRYHELRAMLLDSTHPQSTAEGRRVAESVRQAVSDVIRARVDPEELHRQGKLTKAVAAELRARVDAISPGKAPDSEPDVR